VGGNELPEIEMPRKILPSIEQITTVRQVLEDTQNACAKIGEECGGSKPKCCKGGHCTAFGDIHKCA
jgi:hypothetical protein